MKELYKFKVKGMEQETEFAFMEPSKSVSREGDLVYAKTYADCVRRGLLTNAEAAKIANERGGIFTEQEKEDYIKSLQDFLIKEKVLSDAKTNNEPWTVEQESEVAIIKDKVLYYQNKQDGIFSLTAETKSRDATLLHYALSLTFTGGKAFFEGKDFDARCKLVDDKMDDFRDAVLNRAIWYATALFYGIKNLDEAKYPEDAPVATSTSPDNTPTS